LSRISVNISLWERVRSRVSRCILGKCQMLAAVYSPRIWIKCERSKGCGVMKQPAAMQLLSMF
jgi:hypothetical protein